ncbi:MAG TPA: Ig-like domain-containing protein, partial [Clostridia bacterium]|nr:Ig-like domain-containing protein [Clostridia bacterium]
MKTSPANSHVRKERWILSWCIGCCAHLLLASCLSSYAGTIHLSANGPSPTLLNVLTNEPVIFIADDAGPYAVVSYNWASGTIYLPNQGSTGTVTLRFSGLYNYEDGRGGYGMIYVNIPPSCKISNPTNNAVFTAPASFNFSVDARNTDEDKLMGVDFWLDTTYLDGKMYLPFTVPVSNLGPGTYTLKATAVDYSDGTASDSITITVQAPTLLLSNARNGGGQFVFDVSGVPAGKSVVLEARSTLATADSWVPVQTN